MKREAVFEFKDKEGCLWYRYKNVSYAVNPKLYTPLYVQHRAEQDWIDAQQEKVYKAYEHAQKGFDLFWEYVTSGEF